MNKRSALWLGLFATSLVLAFQNCGGAMSTLQDGGQMDLQSVTPTPGPSNQCVPRPMSKPEASPVSAFGSDSFRVAQELRANPAQTGQEELVAVFDNDCLGRRGASNKVARAATQKGLRPERGLVAYRFRLDQALNQDELNSLFQNEECLHSLDKNAEYELNALPTLPNDSRYSTLTHLSFIKHHPNFGLALNPDNGINRDVRIAVVDSGLDIYHPDLSQNILRSPSGSVVAYNGTDGSDNVFDAGFHGTHVAGLAAAVANNTEGIAGVLGTRAKIIAIKVATDDSTSPLSPKLSLDAVINGVRWAADQGAEVINMSLGGSSEAANRPSLKEAVQYAVSKGSTVVIAAGNDGRVMDATFKTYPAAYAVEIEGVLAVGSVDASTGAISSFSNRSPAFVDLMAPGSNGTVGILSTIPTALAGSGSPYASKYSVRRSDGSVATNTINGTSMASPVAAGGAALMIGVLKSRGFAPTPRQIERLFLAGARKSSNLTSVVKDGNVLDLDLLLSAIDQNTGISSSSTAPRTSATGTVTFSRHPASTTRIYGESVTFEGDIGQGGSLIANLQWYRNGVAIAGATTEKLSLNSLSTSDQGAYVLRATLGSTVVNSQVATLTLGSQYCP